MCHILRNDSRLYQRLFDIDQHLAMQVQAGGCPHCGGPLHVANYPRKPRGLKPLPEDSASRRFSFCCMRDGCRRRCTPPSVRFMGRKVYFSFVVVLATAVQHGLTPKRRQQLIAHLDLWPQTLNRWQRWWRDVVPDSTCWREQHFIPPIDPKQLPGALLGRLHGVGLPERLDRLLQLIAPLTTTSWSGSLRGLIHPQTM